MAYRCWHTRLENNQQPLPYRWGLGGELAPGATTTVTGGIKITSYFEPTHYWAALIQEPTTVQNGVGMTVITSLPQNRP